jgi:hypothetical protein
MKHPFLKSIIGLLQKLKPYKVLMKTLLATKEVCFGVWIRDPATKSVTKALGHEIYAEKCVPMAEGSKIIDELDDADQIL